ncbi:hypothetical protein [Nocardia concava]|uniref:hypothetical protein n=1 Tax=Nocardia concava TaxID=257281 RepID=UPI0002D36718|nr:hypothetical protein [Nocardia concava]
MRIRRWQRAYLAAEYAAWFAARYLRTQSLFTASVEHAAYGMMVFSVGLGRHFYHGAAPAARIQLGATRTG